MKLLSKTPNMQECSSKTAHRRYREGNDGHFAYGTLRLLDSSPTDCSSFYRQDYQSKIKSDV